MHQSELQELIARSKFGRYHAVVLFWGIIILVLDGYDLAVVGVALPAIMADMGIDATQAGFMASSALFGMMFGAISFGTLADRIGRRKTIVICILLLSAFTAASGLANDPVTFSVLRFIAGLGIGGVVPVVTAQMAEVAPARLRGRMITLVFAGYSVGGVIVALVGRQLIEAYGWEPVFYVTALPILLIPFILRSMPESIAFLIKKGRDEEWKATVRKLVPDYPLDPNLKIIPSAENRIASSPVSSLFHEGRGLSTLMIWVAFGMGLFMVYSLSSWLTKLMALAGYSLGSSLNFVLVFNVGAITGALLGGWLGDRFNIKYVLAAFYAIGTVALVSMGYARSTELLFVIVFIVGASTLGTQLLAYAFAGQYYPTQIRSTGIGFATGIGRLGAVLGPSLIGFLVSLQLPLEQNFMAIGVAGFIGTIAVLLIDQTRAAAVTERVIPQARPAT